MESLYVSTQYQLDMLAYLGFRVPEHGTVWDVTHKLLRKYCDLEITLQQSVELTRQKYIVVHRNNNYYGWWQTPYNALKISIDEAMPLYSKEYCSLFIGQPDAINAVSSDSFPVGVIYRFLRIDDRFFWIRFVNNDDWRVTESDRSSIVMDGFLTKHARMGRKSEVIDERTSIDISLPLPENYVSLSCETQRAIDCMQSPLFCIDFVPQSNYLYAIRVTDDPAIPNNVVDAIGGSQKLSETLNRIKSLTWNF